MGKYSIEGTLNTPDIKFDFEKGVLDISGRSIPENSLEFYSPLFSMIDDYINNPRNETIINIQLEYYNSSSSSCLLSVFKKLEKLNTPNGKVSVNWIYEENDEDILSAGKNFQGIINLPFILTQIPED